MRSSLERYFHESVPAPTQSDPSLPTERIDGAAAHTPHLTLVAHAVGPVGGMESQLAVLTTGLLRAGWSVTVIARDCSLPAHERLRWVRVRGPGRPFVLAYPWFAVAAFRLVRRYQRGPLHTTGAIVWNRADVITVHLCHQGLAEKTGVRRAGRANIAYRIHAAMAAAMSRWAERWCFRPRRAGCLVGVSEGVAGELRRHFPSVASNVLVIPNGVDCERFRPDAAVRHSLRRALGLSDRELVVLFVGSEWERKGLAPLVEALANAPSWQLVVVGKGDAPRYRAVISRLGLTPRVLFIGEVRDPAPYYALADAFALPSSYEGCPLVTYEAAASGLPLLLSRVSGIEDLLVDGQNGWFIDRRPAEIARRLKQLGGDEALRRAMGERSRAAALGFGWERVPGAYADLYRSVADERPGTSRRHR